MKFSSLDGREDVEYTGVGFVEITQICLAQNEVFFVMVSLNKLYLIKTVVQMYKNYMR